MVTTQMRPTVVRGSIFYDFLNQTVSTWHLFLSQMVKCHFVNWIYLVLTKNQWYVLFLVIIFKSILNIYRQKIKHPERSATVDLQIMKSFICNCL